MSDAPVANETHLVPVLTGVGGWVSGERYLLQDGDDIVIGRSRSCDISLRRVSGYLNRPGDQRDNDHDFNTVSRRHLRIQVKGETVRVEDISTNGTYCNEEVLAEPRDVSISEKAVSLRLGTRESFRLEMLKASEAADAHRPAPAAGGGD